MNRMRIMEEASLISPNVTSGSDPRVTRNTDSDGRPTRSRTGKYDGCGRTRGGDPSRS